MYSVLPTRTPGLNGKPVFGPFSGRMTRQLWHARRLIRAAAASIPLVQASAEQVPLTASSFDLVLCDHGAMSFADPDRVLLIETLGERAGLTVVERTLRQTYDFVRVR